MTDSPLITGLRTALPYLRLFQGKTFVIKIGGEACDEPAALNSLIEQIAVLQQVNIRVVLVHGGGPQATRLTESLGIETRFVDGRRITSPEAVEAMVMALNGTTRTQILAAARRHGLPAIGLSGIDAGLIRASRKPPVKTSSGEIVDYGQAGKVDEVRPEILHSLIESGVVPVITSLSADDQGVVYNINADDVSAAIAVALRASKYMVVTQPRGILRDVENSSSLVSQIDLAELAQLEADGIVAGGMLPKARALRHALEGGVEQAHVISYRYKDAILNEVFTNEGCGTMVLRHA